MCTHDLPIYVPNSPLTRLGTPARAEWMFYDSSGAPIPIISAVSTSPPGPPQSAAAIYDGDSGTKWTSSFNANSGLTLTFELPSGSEPMSYAYITANDDANRDPSGWTIDKLVSGGREALPSVSSFVPPAGRYTPTGKFSLGTGTLYEVSFNVVVGSPQTDGIQIAGKRASERASSTDLHIHSLLLTSPHSRLPTQNGCSTMPMACSSRSSTP